MVESWVRVRMCAAGVVIGVVLASFAPDWWVVVYGVCVYVVGLVVPSWQQAGRDEA